MSTQSKIALITGGSRGLGKNAAIKIAKKGIDVILTYQSKKEAADNTVEEIKKLGVNAIALQLNIADVKSFDVFFIEVASVLKSVFKADKFDFLINNAGIGIYAPFAETSEEQFDTLVNIHLKGAFFLTQKALPLFDFIIPIIPVINSSNSSQKLLEKSTSYGYNWSEDLIDSLSLFVDDMRLNVQNRFRFFKDLEVSSKVFTFSVTNATWPHPGD